MSKWLSGKFRNRIKIIESLIFLYYFEKNMATVKPSDADDNLAYRDLPCYAEGHMPTAAVGVALCGWQSEAVGVTPHSCSEEKIRRCLVISTHKNCKSFYTLDMPRETLVPHQQL